MIIKIDYWERQKLVLFKRSNLDLRNVLFLKEEQGDPSTGGGFCFRLVFNLSFH